MGQPCHLLIIPPNNACIWHVINYGGKILDKQLCHINETTYPSSLKRTSIGDGNRATYAGYFDQMITVTDI